MNEDDYCSRYTQPKKKMNYVCRWAKELSIAKKRNISVF
jgi:hypothetical protein